MYSALCKFLLDNRKKIISKLAYRPTKFTIGVGSCVLGGGGKTETASFIAKQLSAYNPCIVVKGYKGKIKGPVLINESLSCPKLIGDEAVLLFNKGHKVIVSHHKTDGVKYGEKFFDLIIVDDSFQHPYFCPYLNILTIPCEEPSLAKDLKNEQFFPFGALRDSFQTCLKRADAVLLINRLGEKNCEDDFFRLTRDKPTFFGFYDLCLPIENSEVTGVCSIARSKAFEKFISSKNQLLKIFRFQDHHLFNQSDIETLEKSSPSGLIVTTEKDYVKISRLKTELTWISVKTNLQVQETFLDFLRNKISKAV